MALHFALMITQPNTRREINWTKETFRSGPWGGGYSIFSLDSTKLPRMPNCSHWTTTQWEHLKAMCYLGCSTKIYVGINPRWRMAMTLCQWVCHEEQAGQGHLLRKTFVYLYFSFVYPFPFACSIPLFFLIGTSNLLANLLICSTQFL